MSSLKRKKGIKVVDCCECDTQADCCRMGAWIDLEEAKRIVSSGIKGDFFHLEKDEDFPSGYKVGTSFEDEPCSFLGSDGLCAVHKVGYHLKPVTCKEFPYEDGKVSPFVDVLCTMYKKNAGRKKKKARGR